ncbi:MAG: hypothetical protein KC589_04295 [Nanoarchaeota archaeon]|nr:hypothetical protein [Nanoarchaeota archaeon]
MNNKDIENEIISIIYNHGGLKSTDVFSRLSWKSLFYTWKTKLNIYDLMAEMINFGKMDCIEYWIGGISYYFIIPKKTVAKISCQYQ